MTSTIIKNVLWAGILVSALSVSRFGASLNAQQSATSAVDALQKARVLGRLAEALPAEHGLAKVSRGVHQEIVGNTDKTPSPKPQPFPLRHKHHL